MSKTALVALTVALVVSLTLWLPPAPAGAADGVIDHYVVYSTGARSQFNLDSPQIASRLFSVTIEARDSSSNRVTTGAGSTETVSITLIKQDAAAVTGSVATYAGSAVFNVTLTVAQNGQAIIVRGAASGKTGLSNSFDVVTRVNEKGSGTTSVVDSVESNGRFIYLAEALSDDQKVRLSVPANTIGQQLSGIRLVEIIMVQAATPQSPPTDTAIVGLVYSLLPYGATFNPPASLVVTYDPALMPAGVAEERLYVGLFDRATSAWTRLPGTVDAAANTVTATVNRFSDFAVFAPSRPASFTVTGLSISPSPASVGQSVTVSAHISNVGDLGGTYSAELRVDGVLAERRDVTVPGGGSQAISFTLKRDIPGAYPVNIGGTQFATLTVSAPSPTTASPKPAVSPSTTTSPTPTQTPTATPTPKPTVSPSPAPTAPTASPTITFSLPEPSPNNEPNVVVWVVVLLLSSLVFSAGIVVLVRMRKKPPAASPPPPPTPPPAPPQ